VPLTAVRARAKRWNRAERPRPPERRRSTEEIPMPNPRRKTHDDETLEDPERRESPLPHEEDDLPPLDRWIERDYPIRPALPAQKFSSQ
jgi:hypothetical protein